MSLFEASREHLTELNFHIGEIRNYVKHYGQTGSGVTRLIDAIELHLYYLENLSSRSDKQAQSALAMGKAIVAGHKNLQLAQTAFEQILAL